MKNLPIILAFCGLTFNLSVLNYYHASIPFFWSQAPNTLTSENISVEFNIRPVDYTKTIDMTGTKIAYAQKISADLFKAVEQNNLIVAGNPKISLTRRSFNWHMKNLVLKHTGIKKLYEQASTPCRFTQTIHPIK